MLRREVRYLLYRIRSREELGRPVDLPEGFEDIFQNQEDFTSWVEFARRWDVGDEGDHLRVVPLNRSEEERWNRRLEEISRELV